MSTTSVGRMPTGIVGLDEVLGGGLPLGITALVVGSPGTGKTILATQVLAAGVQLEEPGVLVTFEESSARTLASAQEFGWLAADEGATSLLSVMDGRDVRTAFRNGNFDLVGLLSAVGHRCDILGARRLAFDGLDVLLDLIDDPGVMRREVYRLSDWLSERKLTTIVTAKLQAGEEELAGRYSFLSFLADCVIVLRHHVVDRTASRSLRVVKCRGAAHSSNELPMVLSATGMRVVAPAVAVEQQIFAERISSGVARLDTMLDGGYLRGTCTLVSGAPGTSKTTLAGAFVEAACARGERALFVSFDEAADAIAANLGSVNIRLEPYVQSGLLRMLSIPVGGSVPEVHAMRIENAIDSQRPTCLAIDPISALVNTGGNRSDASTMDAVLSILYRTRRTGISVLLTSLVDGVSSEENSIIGVSATADTWIHVSYVASGGERNRALTIVKSRGTGHSNQVRELVLSKEGVSLVDVYTANGAVLMGTLRLQKEAHEQAALVRSGQALEAERIKLVAELSRTRAQLVSLRGEEERQKAELASLAATEEAEVAQKATDLEALRLIRGADDLPLEFGRRGSDARDSTIGEGT